MIMNWLTDLVNLNWSPILWGGLWAGLVALILGLSFLLWTRWGYYHLIGKCVLFSVLAHLVLGLFFATAEVVEAVGPLLPAGLSSPITIEVVRISADSDAGTEGAGNRITATPDPAREWDRPRNAVTISPAPLESTARELPTPPTERPAQTADELPKQSPRPELPVAEKQPDQPRLAQAAPDAPDRAQAITAPQQPLAQASEQPKGAVPQSTAIPMTPQFGIGSAPSPRRMATADTLPRDNALVATIARAAPISDRGSLALPDLPVAAMLPARPVETSASDATKPSGAARLPIATPDLIASAAPAKQPEPKSRPPEPAPDLRNGSGLPGGVAKETSAPTRASRSDPDAVPLPASRAGTEAGLATSDASAPTPVRAIGPNGPAGDRAGMRLGTAEIYRNRINPNRSELAVSRGGSRASEQAVERALEWLVAHQNPDGHWDGDGFMIHCPKDSPCTGPGRQNRDDCALTGLVLLAFLGAGHTHQAGSYADPVSRAIDWLLAQQKPNGDLRGPGRMYSQGIATLALSEALGMTGDPRLRNPVERAVRFIVAAQHPTSGGWRYDPGNYGDTSIFGWQLMALKSASLVDVAVPDSTWQKARGWLSIVGSGRARGLASYLPGEAVTPAMTAEALACREFLGATASDPAVREAAEYIMNYLPHRERQNLYYWYYGTVALFQIGGPQWDKWNTALRDLLISQQRRDGHAAGSWEPRGDPWGNEGGRVYTTALSTLCLEVYYRYLPLQSIGTDETHEPTRLPAQAGQPASE